MKELVKGQLDWHETVNENFKEVAQTAGDATQAAENAAKAAGDAAQEVKDFGETLENKLNKPNVTAQLLQGFLYYDQDGNVSIREVDSVPKEVQVIIREHINIFGGMDELWETGISWDIDELMELVGVSKFNQFAIGDYVPVSDGNKWRIVSKMHYPRWAFTDSYQEQNNTAPPHIILMPDKALGTQKYNNTNVNTGGYAASLMPARMETEFGKLPAEIKKYVTQTRIYENNKAAWAAVYRNMRIPTQAEIFGHLGWTDAYGGGAPCQLELMNNVKHRIKEYWYWCLDPSSVNTSAFCSANYGGFSTYGNASNEGSIRPLIVLTNQQS